MNSSSLTSAEKSGQPNIQPIDLGQKGVAFMRSALNQNCLLSSLVAAQFTEKDKVFALLPDGISLARARQFKRGGLVKKGVSHKWFANYIFRDLLQGDVANGQLVFEDPWLKISDLNKIPSKQPYFQSGSTVYYVPDSRDVLSALDNGMREVRSFLLIGFVISPPVFVPTNGGVIEKNALELLAQRTQAVFVSAYDQESYVVWQR